LSIAPSFFFPITIFLLVPLFAVNSVFHYKNKGNINYYLQGIRELSKSFKVTRKLSNQVIVTNHFKGFSFIKKIEVIMFQSEFIAFEKKINNEWLFPIWLLIDLIKIVFKVAYLIFYSFLDALTKKKKSNELMHLFIGEIDVAISTASLKSGDLKICTPSFDASNKLDVSAIYHPLIENCIPNNVDLLNKSMLLTCLVKVPL
jgi:DNA mismatch repair ATPase MutS